MSIFSIIDSFVESLTPLCTFSLLWGPEQDWYIYSQRFAPHFPSQLPLGDRRHPTWVASLSSVLSKAIFIRFYGLDGGIMTIISQRSCSAPCWTGLLRSRQISGLQPSYHPNPLFYSIQTERVKSHNQLSFMMIKSPRLTFFVSMTTTESSQLPRLLMCLNTRRHCDAAVSCVDVYLIYIPAVCVCVHVCVKLVLWWPKKGLRIQQGK